MAGQDNYILKSTFQYPNAIIKVYVPDISDEEREKRRRQFVKATEIFLRKVEKDRLEREGKA